jgi:hypothetical protein
MKTLRSLLFALVAIVTVAVPSFAQTTISSTTLGAAVAATDPQFNVASVSGMVVGDLAVVIAGNRVREVAVIREINSPYIRVSRHAVPVQDADRATTHANGSTVYFGVKARFYSSDVAGTCTRASERFLPHINPSSGNVSQCSPAGVWYRLDEQFTVACYTGPLATHSVDQSCWTVDRNYVITKITYVSKVVETAGTLTIIPRRQQSTEAPASGDALATAISGVSTVAETVTDFTLTTTSALLLLTEDERLGLDFTDDVAGELLGVLVTFTLAPR